MQQIAQVISQISIYTVNQSVTGEVAVTAQVDFTQQEEADSVCAELVNKSQRINYIALRFGHFIAVNNEPAVTIYLFRHFHTHSVEHNGPNNGVEADNFLAYQMQACRPVFIEHSVISAIFNTGQIVQESVEPYVYNVLFVKGNRNTPVKGGTGNAQILQALFNKVDHLIAAACRLNEIRVFFDELQPPVLIFRHFEEIAFLFHFFYRTAAVGAFAINQLTLQPVGFAGNAVQALVVFLINIALLKNLLQHVLHNLVVTFFAGTDKVIVGNVQLFPKQFKISDNSVYILDRGNALFLGFALNFQTMLITAGQEKYILALQTVKTCQAVGNSGAVCVTNMQIVTGIINRCSNIKGGFCHLTFRLLLLIIDYIAPFWGFYVV
ncbi:hypothetical protein, membrane [gut metagenome]|uniref:Uncharacterized protein n=1 Tax=gut metagenome TaxID=749906 RepID=J9GW30_9ZZZZ